MSANFEATLAWAHARDAADPLRAFRDEFLIPPHEGRDGRPSDSVYFCGNSLGLQPRAVREAVNAELDYWGELGVEGHFKGRLPWMDYHEFVRDDLAAVVGALPSEVVAMNTLGVNLHLMMVSFYRPTAERPAILIEAGAFPTDRYAVESQIRFHGFDPASALIELEADEPNGTISLAAIERALAEHGSRIALVMLPGVQYRTGQAFDLKAITELGHKHGCTVGFDLAHAVGNLPLQLHDSGADFAIWCSYKYLNSGPGAVGGAFVHERHAQGRAAALRRLVGPRQDHPLPDGPGVRAHPRRRRLAAVQPADPGAGAAARVAGDLPPRRHARPAAKNRGSSPATWNGWCRPNSPTCCKW